MTTETIQQDRRQPMTATLSKQDFRSFIDLARSFTDEAKITSDGAGLNVKTVDPAHVALLKATIPADDAGDGSSWGMDFDAVKPFLTNSGDDTFFHFKEDGCIVLESEGVERTFKCIDTTNFPEPNIPRMVLPATVKVMSQDLLKIVKHSDAVSDHVAFNVDGGTFTVAAEGEGSRVEKAFPDAVESNDGNPNLKSCFSLDYLTGFLKNVPKGVEITVNMGTDYPFIASFRVGVVDYEVWVAPRIESE